LVSKEKHLVINTLSNVFTMRLIGNKTHGDLAEIGIAEFINQFMYDFRCTHVGKDLFRAKEKEEDIVIMNEITKENFPVSLKAYGDGPLQLSTDKNFKMFPYLEKKGKVLSEDEVFNVFSSEAFMDFKNINIMPLIYDERKKQCNIMIFDYQKAIKKTKKIMHIGEGENFGKSSGGKSRKHPIYMFLDENDNYICEVRYGGPSANALQRGLWTHTKNAFSYFDSLTNGWIDYSHNKTLVRLFCLALNATEKGHEMANDILQNDINRFKREKE